MPTLPEVDELVLATVRKILPYGAFCTLDEYGNLESFLHISEVAPRWIKNIHEFLHEGQHLVAKVHHIDPEKGQVDISIKKVTEAEKKRKLETVRHEKRSQKLFDIALKQAKSTAAEAQAARAALAGKFGDLLIAFEAISEEGEAAIAGLKIEKGLAKAMLAVAQKSMRKAKAEIKTEVMLTSYAADGIARVKKALASLQAPAGVEMELHYLGAPHYQVTVSGKDFKEAEKALDALAEQLEARAKPDDMAIEWKKRGGE